jgi:hypothetical protein
MQLSEYIQQQPNETTYFYVGTIWGSDPFSYTKAQLLEMLAELPEYGGEIAETHPAYGQHEYDEFGQMVGKFYIESGDIHYHSRYAQELVLRVYQER